MNAYISYLHAHRIFIIKTTGYASDDLDDLEGANDMDVDEEVKVVNSPKKRKLSKTTEARLKAKEKKKSGKKGSDDDDDDGAYTALSKSYWASSTRRPPVGNFESCSICEKQFTVVSLRFLCSSLNSNIFQTKYTMASSTGDGFLCHKCAKAGGNDPFKKPTVPRKRKVASEKRVVTTFQERRFPTLVSLCVQVRHPFCASFHLRSPL